MAELVGTVTGRGFANTILYVAMPMMSGGMGAGVMPLSEIYASATGIEQAQIISQMIPASAIGNVHAYAFMIIVVVLCKIAGVVPEKYEQAAVQWSQFVMKNFTSAILAGIGIAHLDLKELAAAISPEFMIICVAIIVTVAVCAGFFGKIVGF